MKKGGYTINKTAVCADCNGEGKITIPGERISHGAFSDPQTKKCTTCNGFGMVNIRRIVYTEITPKHAKNE